MEFNEIFKKAHFAGNVAGSLMIPAPMNVLEEQTISDQVSISKVYHVPEGVCGFAWVTIRPGNSPAAKYAKKWLGFRKAYEGGVQLWISDYGQSYQRKMQYAEAYAKVLNDNGIKAYAGGRLD